MDINLFANISEEIEEQKEKDSNVKVKSPHPLYGEMLKSRVQPELKEEQLQIDIKKVYKEEVRAKKAELKAHSYNDVLKKATEYFDGDSLAANVWLNKYALKNSDGELFECTPDDMHRRIAKEIARIEEKYPQPLSEEGIFQLLKNFKYIIPAGSPMAGIGNTFQASSLSNCFVIGNDGNSDSYGGIMKVDQEQVQLMKRRGGVGHDLSHIRPGGSRVNNSALSSTGIVPFMERYSNSTREVAQDGRRGALMLSISVKHPDVEKFIDAKLEEGKITGANVSVKITDDFMNALKNEQKYTQQYPIESNNPSHKIETNAKGIWDKIIHNAWKSAEPGILFWDTIIRESVPDSYSDQGFKTVSTNPCGEIPLCPYDSCRLIAINLYSYVENPFTDKARFNSELFVEHVHYTQRIMDDIIDLEVEKINGILNKIDNDPEDYDTKRIERTLWENIKKKTLDGRRTGIGITAEGDMIAALGCRYGSDEATNFSVEVHKLLAIEAYRSSVELAKLRGAFPIYNSEKEKSNPFIQRMKEAAPKVYENMLRYGRRNIALLTIAPTGSVSICAQTSSGIEPVFMVHYKRRRKVNPNDQKSNIAFVDEVGDSWEEYTVFHHNFMKWAIVNGYKKEAIEQMNEAQLNEVIKKSPYYKATANDIDWVSKVKMQGAIQKWVDHSISVTVNVPAETNEQLVSDIYQTAWESGCKGITIYRDGSRSGVLVSDSKKEDDNCDFKETQAPQRPKILDAEVLRFQNNKERWIAFVGLYKNKPYEIFTGKAEDFIVPQWVNNGQITRKEKSKKDERAQYDFSFTDKQGYEVIQPGLSRSFEKEYWNYAKLISGILRHGMPLPFVVELVSNLDLHDETINTWKNGVVRAIKKFIPDGTEVPEKQCPECGAKNALIYKEGCLMCPDCGYSKCG